MTDLRDAEAQRMLNIPYRIIWYNQTISFTRPTCWIQISTVAVINSCLTTIRRLWHSPANWVDSTWDNQPFHKYGWWPPKFKWFTWPNHAPFRDCLLSVGLHLLPSTYLRNLKSLTPLITKIWREIQNVENKVVWSSWGHSRSLEIAPIDRVSISVA